MGTDRYEVLRRSRQPLVLPLHGGEVALGGGRYDGVSDVSWSLSQSQVAS